MERQRAGMVARIRILHISLNFRNNSSDYIPNGANFAILIFEDKFVDFDDIFMILASNFQKSGSENLS